MTPKEKADELIEKFSDDFNYDTELEYLLPRCALIAVNEILLIADIMDVCGEEEKSYEYWMEVKTEIEKL